MQDTTVTLLAPTSATLDPTREGNASAISWASIIGGALATIAVSVILVTLGGAIGIMPTSPPDSDRTVMMMTSITAIWLIVTQWIASFVGGYLTGRLRTKWVAVHTHEVFFRDTAHGFLAWSGALLVGVGLLSSTLGSMAGHMSGARGSAAMHSAGPESDGSPLAYYVHSLYRLSSTGGTPVRASEPISAASSSEGVPVSGTEPAPSSTASAAAIPTSGSVTETGRISPELRAETSHILSRAAAEGGLSADDKTYLGQLVADHTGLTPSAASKRVDTVTAQAEADAQKLHKAVGYAALFAALAMLIGAFIGCAASALGGSQRDEWEEAVRTGRYGAR